MGAGDWPAPIAGVSRDRISRPASGPGLPASPRFSTDIPVALYRSASSSPSGCGRRTAAPPRDGLNLVDNHQADRRVEFHAVHPSPLAASDKAHVWRISGAARPDHPNAHMERSCTAVNTGHASECLTSMPCLNSMSELHVRGELCRVAMGGLQGRVRLSRGTRSPVLGDRAVRCTSLPSSHNVSKAMQRGRMNSQREATPACSSFCIRMQWQIVTAPGWRKEAWPIEICSARSCVGGSMHARTR